MRQLQWWWMWVLAVALPAQEMRKIESAASLLEQARAHWEQEDPAALCEVVQRAEARWPRAPWVLLGLGLAQAMPGDAWDREAAGQAMERFLAALEAAEERFDPLVDGPLDELARFVRLPVHGSLAQLRRAVADQLRALGDPDAGEPSGDALALGFTTPDPELGVLRQELASARQLRQRARLVAAATQLLRLHPADPLPCLALGEAYGAVGAGFSQTRALLAFDRFLLRTGETADPRPAVTGLGPYLRDRALETLAAVRGKVVAWRAELAAGRRLLQLATRAELEPLLADNQTRTLRAQARVDSLKKDLSWWRASRRSDAPSTMREIEQAITGWQRTLADLKADAQLLRPQLEEARRAETEARR